MKTKRYQMAVAKSLSSTTTVFKRVQHASKAKVIDAAVALGFEGFKPVEEYVRQVNVVI